MRQTLKRHACTALALGLAGVATAAPARADSTAGVDAHLFRPAIDSQGVFTLEGAEVLPRHDLSVRFFLGYGQNPLKVAVPGIGGRMELGKDSVLGYSLDLDIALAFSVTKKLSVGLETGLYRTDTDAGYGVRGHYAADPANRTPSTGLISLRPLSNIDPSGGYEPQGLSGPLDVRLGFKYLLFAQKKMKLALLGIAGIPFGNDEMFLGDKNYVIEPRFALDFKLGGDLSTSKLVFNVGARFRERTVLQAYDKDIESPAQATAVLDVGSEALAGAGIVYEATPRVLLGAEGMAFIPLPSSVSYGDCKLDDGSRCSSLTDADYYGDAKEGDLAAYALAGATVRATAELGVALLGGAGIVGARREDFRITAGITWTPTPAGSATIGRGDKDGDGIPDVSDVCGEEPEDKDNYQDEDGCPDLDNDGDGIIDASDACPEEPEDKDDYEDADGCPERDNDGDGIPDITDRCPMDKEDVDGFEDGDGCPEEDNDGDGIADSKDRCPNDPETVNGVDDTDGCPDTRSQTGPEEGVDRINMRGNKIEFAGDSDRLTGGSRTVLDQVADLIKNKGLLIRIEVHVSLGTRSKNAKQITRQKVKDKDLSQKRAQAIFDYLVSKGVPQQSLTGAVGLGSDRPLGNNPPTDPLNERVDLIKARQ